jgi:hypothetical protein
LSIFISVLHLVSVPRKLLNTSYVVAVVLIPTLTKARNAMSRNVLIDEEYQTLPAQLMN